MFLSRHFRSISMVRFLVFIGLLVCFPITLSHADKPKEAAAPTSKTPSQPKPDTIRVLVWNVWHAGNDVDKGPEKILALIKKHQADICLLQESYDIKGDRPKLGKWVAGQLGWNQFQDKSTHLSIVTRFPMKKTFFHSVWHGVGARLDTGNGKELIAYSIWIDYRSGVGGYLKGNPQATNTDILACETKHSDRLKQAKAILAHLKKEGHLDSKLPLLVGGDWNCPSHFDWTKETAKAMPWRRNLPLPVSLAMKKQGFLDAYRYVYPDPVKHPGNTWSPLFRTDKSGNALPLNRIDRLYIKKAESGETYVPVSAKVLPEKLEDNAVPTRKRKFPSDHSALLIELEWKAGSH